MKPDWKVSDIFIGNTDSEVCRKVLHFFGGIASSGGRGLEYVELPRVHGGLGEFGIQHWEVQPRPSGH